VGYRFTVYITIMDHFDTFNGTLEEYRSKFVILEIPECHGLGNVLIFLCDFFCAHPHDGVVPMELLGYEYDTWLTFHFPVTRVTGFTRSYKPKIAINHFTSRNIHPYVRQLIEPSDDMKKVIKDHEHLVAGVAAGLQIRCGGLFPDSKRTVDENNMFANRAAIEKFKSVPGPVFIASDSPMLKLEFPHARTLDTEISVLHKGAPEASRDHRRNVFLDFFLLSKCPVLYITAGDPDDSGALFSTFGYMAGMYGNCQINLIFNNI